MKPNTLIAYKETFNAEGEPVKKFMDVGKTLENIYAEYAQMSAGSLQKDNKADYDEYVKICHRASAFNLTRLFRLTTKQAGHVLNTLASGDLDAATRMCNQSLLGKK